MIRRMALDRSLRVTFDAAAKTYQTARPEYPDALYDDLIALTGIVPPARLLEVGCGPGKATLPLARRGFVITAVELGAALAAQARANLGAFPNVEVVNTAFESWTPPDAEPYALVYAATAWPWIDPDVKYAKAASVLRPGGHLAIWGAIHGFPSAFDPFFTEIQAVYDELDDSCQGDWPPPTPDEVSDDSAEIEASGLFDVVDVRRYVWAIDYDADGYLALLDTFSGHIAMEPDKRAHLYREIRRRIDARPSRTIHRHWLAILNVAQRR